MVLSCNALAEEISRGSVSAEGIAVVPTPDLEALKKGGEPSIPLRLGRWFLSMRLSNESNIPATHDPKTRHGRIGKNHFVPFGATFVLHPNRFVLASTLEWIRLSERLVAFVVGKSTLGRRGIVIETAAGVHPGFSGCLTLEIANVGEMPVKFRGGNDDWTALCAQDRRRIVGSKDLSGGSAQASYWSNSKGSNVIQTN